MDVSYLLFVTILAAVFCLLMHVVSYRALHSPQRARVRPLQPVSLGMYLICFNKERSVGVCVIILV